jgi:hypothetical protein
VTPQFGAPNIVVTDDTRLRLRLRLKLRLRLRLRLRLLIKHS